MKSARKTPIGNVLIEENGGFITRLEFSAADSELEKSPNHSELLDRAFGELEDYLCGKLEKFSVPLNPAGTEFQRRVWAELLKIPYGKTAAYKEIAIMAGNSRAVRAVGMANNRNPIPIMIPCHRVVGSNGKLVGYAGGLDMKRRLLDLEQNGAAHLKTGAESGKGG